MSAVTQVDVVKSILCLLLIVFSLSQSMAGHDCTVKAIKKVNGKETTVFTIKSSVLPSSTRLEVINQELPWMEEILFRFVSDERPVPGFTCIVRRFYVDLFSVIRPSNAP
jgi:hypothetical protein